MIVERAVTAGLAALALAGCGVTGNFRHDPGYASFHAPRELDRDLGLSLGPLPLRLARLVVDDEELAPLLEELRAVRVYSYGTTGEPERIARALDETRAKLVDEGWLPLAVVREDMALTAVLLRIDDEGRNRGLAVIAQEPTEVVLVNLIGNVRLDLFSEYMAEIDVETPGIEIDPRALEASVR
jgi:hypothetical protein